MSRNDHALREEVEQARLIIESAPNAIVMVNADGNIVLINAQTEKIFGYRREELVGRPIEILLPERFRAKHVGYRETFLAMPKPRLMGVGRDLHALHKDGSEFPVEVGLNPIQTSQGVLVLSAIVDITERKRAEDASVALAAIVESSSDAIIGKTLQGIITSWNPAAAALYGYAGEEIIGQPIAVLAPDDRRSELPLILERISRGERIDHFETVRVRKNGTRVDISLTVSPVIDHNGKVIGASAIARDITEQRRAQAILRKSKTDLEQALSELEARSEEVKSMTQQLWQAAKLASVGELAAGIAHELNNPLATIALRIESVLGRTPADDPRRRALEIIEQEAKRMGELVSSLLQFARRGEDKFSTVDLPLELTKAVELIQHHLRKRLISVEQVLAQDTPHIYADRQKLRQVFLNLLTNASDAMPEGGTLTLCTSPVKLNTGGPGVQVDFVDTGVGIAMEHLEKVMDPFFTTKEEGRGTGLGLAICRRIVQEHHGVIEILSEVGKGTTVRIVLPVTSGANVKGLRKPAP